ncbi:MAG: hypothetical protein ABH840_00070 [Nanoarchaeota archaeon]
MKEARYIDAAYNQRDIVRSIVPNSPAFFADVFLKEWDKDYREFVPPKNPRLVYVERPGMEKLPRAETYDTREALPLLEKNIEGFKIEDRTIGTHDVNVSYRGAGFHIMAGSYQPHEVPRRNILRALRRITKEDVDKKDINPDEAALRLEVLKNYTFE